MVQNSEGISIIQNAPGTIKRKKSLKMSHLEIILRSQSYQKGLVWSYFSLKKEGSLSFIINIPMFRRIKEEMYGESGNPSTNRKNKSAFTSYFVLAVKIK